MSFKWNYIWQFSMLFGVFCKFTWHMVCKTCFLLLSWDTSWVVADATSPPFVGFGDCTIPSFEPFKTMAHPWTTNPFLSQKRKKNTHPHTHVKMM
jgi:hypothetical protein